MPLISKMKILQTPTSKKHKDFNNFFGKRIFLRKNFHSISPCKNVRNLLPLLHCRSRSQCHVERKPYPSCMLAGRHWRSVLLLRWNDAPHTPSWVGNIAASPRDQMHVAMEDGLPCVLACVDPDIKARDGWVCCDDQSPLIIH